MKIWKTAAQVDAEGRTVRVGGALFSAALSAQGGGTAREKDDPVPA